MNEYAVEQLKRVMVVSIQIANNSINLKRTNADMKQCDFNCKVNLKQLQALLCFVGAVHRFLSAFEVLHFYLSMRLTIESDLCLSKQFSNQSAFITDNIPNIIANILEYLGHFSSNPTTNKQRGVFNVNKKTHSYSSLHSYRSSRGSLYRCSEADHNQLANLYMKFDKLLMHDHLTGEVRI
ncbi:hypothetical protein T12_4139 [Trichinella patagoniensis]|uniref:Uncharacterized protein n=1 Tax=Trichinella patagoniensis TaxID=990121 RepID=A0A0V0ZBI5_9BILA|nr:hypothetical protein T12_4139 [Trichinella patagoniensis]